MKTSSELKNLQKTLLDALKSKDALSFEDGKTASLSSPRSLKKCVVVVCFGTPNVPGDAFGPIVADSLREICEVPVFVYGTSENPITAKNMAEKLDFVSTVHKGDLIISVDASLGDVVGGVAVRKDGVCPAAVKGRKKRFGDVGILGIVAKPSEDALVSLMTADFLLVERLAKNVANAISEAIA